MNHTSVGTAPQDVRKALLLDLTPGQEPPLKLEFSGWSIDHTQDFDSADAQLDNHQYSVAIAHFEHLSKHQIGQLEHLLNSHPVEWIALTHAEDLLESSVQRLLCEYCYDYYTLPIQQHQSYLQAALGHLYGLQRLRDQLGIQPLEYQELEMVGASPVMQQLFSHIRKIASVDAPVLIQGESGTGKELIARAIHQRSERYEEPFIAVNCGALPDNLIQSELFGYERGAFTGATRQKLGRIEAADGGTILLDEIGDLALDLQTHLLRFLQEHTIERLGGTRSIPINTRVIAATHVCLQDAVAAGRFREDLFYRLNVLTLEVPPLRERDGDIPLLAQYFFSQFADEKRGHVRGFSPAAITALEAYHWPGNIREMINRIRRALVMSENNQISPADLGFSQQDCPLQPVITLDEARNQAEQNAITNTLRATKFNVSKAARQLGVSRVTLYRLLNKYQIPANPPA